MLAQKYIPEKVYLDWKKEYDAANSTMVNRSMAIEKSIESLEYDMELIGISGVEDKLQEDIQ